MALRISFFLWVQMIRLFLIGPNDKLASNWSQESVSYLPWLRISFSLIGPKNNIFSYWSEGLKLVSYWSKRYLSK